MGYNDFTAFCINCGCKRHYKMVSGREETEVRGIKFGFVETKAICEDCGEELYIPDLNDANVSAREDAYRKAAGLITVDEINRILKKYDIGAGPLAKILGFGEITITRYIGGQIPSKQNSDILLNVLSSHRIMRQYVESNKDELTPIAYRKCEETLQQFDELYGSKKIEVVIRYFLRKMTEVTPLALQKMLYYAQSFYFALFDEELFPDACQAWQHGPVYPEVYHKYKIYGYNPIEAPELDFGEETGELNAREVEFLDSIIIAFGCYSGQALEKMTHGERPWIKARGSLLPSDRSVTEIDKSEIYAYFSEVIKTFNIINPCDIIEYSDAMMRRTQSKC